jgi:2-polyprenyl-6-methoxyphenol hydroxylase-like FAD-dependent oxidoreductase
MRIIIAGGGPAGLVLGHALSKASIDFVILEKRYELIEASGAALGLWPHSVRVLDQLGLFDAALKIAPKMTKSINLGPKGELLDDTDMFTMIGEK